MPRLDAIGCVFFALAIAGFGLMHLVRLDFVTRLVPTPQAPVPGRAAMAGTIGRRKAASRRRFTCGILGEPGKPRATASAPPPMAAILTEARPGG